MGLTAFSSDVPDSFEVKSFVVRFPHEELPSGQAPPAADHSWHAPPPASSQYDEYKKEQWHWTDEKAHLKDADASKFKNEKERFQDLHDRVMLLNHQMDIMFHDISLFKEQTEEKNAELIHWLAPIHDFTSQSKHMLETLESTIVLMQKDLEISGIKKDIEDLRRLVADSHMSLVQHLPDHVHSRKLLNYLTKSKLTCSVIHATTPRAGWIIFLVVLTQLMLAASYLIYKRRQDMQPKKYL
jgi:mannose-binding lectin 1